jgi:exopolysaccharide biosynthesis protein
VSILLFTPARLFFPGIALAAVLLRGCPGEVSAPVRQAKAAPGVVIREVTLHEGTTRVRVIDADLSAPGVKVEIAADDIARRSGRVTGAAYSVADWVERTGAVAGVNGGFFGERVGDHLEIVGLLKLDGRVRSAAPSYRAQGGSMRYSRAALGFTRENEPSIAWVGGRSGAPQMVLSYPEPVVAGSGDEWNVRQAVACGPRLIHDGKVEVTYRDERLASPGRLPRTFVGYGKDHLVLCAATGLEFQECAEFLARYFREAHDSPCLDGMCLDGGGSTQAAWRDGGEIRTDSPLNIEVPTAILVHSR